MQACHYMLVMLVATLMSSAVHARQKVRFEVEATIQQLPDGKVRMYVREKDESGNTTIDSFSTTSKNGKFKISGNASRDVMASILLDARGRNAASFYIEPGKLYLTGHFDSLDHIRRKGTPENELYTRSSQEQQRIYDQMAPYRNRLQAMGQVQNDSTKFLSKKLADLQDSVNAYRIRFIKQNPNSLTSAVYLYVLQGRINSDLVEQLYDALTPRVKKQSYANTVESKIIAERRTTPGKKAPDFSIVDWKGQSLSINSFKGKYVLLEFWASWCVPCRKENPTIKEVYAAYHAKGFEILGISIDEDADKWKKAIAEDDLPWLHYRESRTSNNSISTLYGVQPIPDNFLIGPDGRIVAANLRGEALKEIMSKLLP